MYQKNTAGWIYVLEDQLGHYKIGKTQHLDKRINQLRIQLPYKVATYAVLYVDDCHQAEREIHKALAKYRVNGEWFKMDSYALADLLTTCWELDDSFSHQHFWVFREGQPVRYIWASAADLIESNVPAKPVLFDLLERVCLDDVCNEYGLPRSWRTRELLAPEFADVKEAGRYE